jgi:hypothetical protein
MLLIVRETMSTYKICINICFSMPNPRVRCKNESNAQLGAIAPAIEENTMEAESGFFITSVCASHVS